MNLKVININPYAPAYDLYKENRPPINWNTSTGSWVGIWGYSWSDVLGNEVLKNTDEIDYEVWRPDLRADKIYSHRFESGVVHKSYPGIQIKKMHGMKIITRISSPKILESLEQIEPGNIVLHLNSPGYGLNQEIIKKFPNIPKVIEFHSKLTTPDIEMKRLRLNIFANISYLKQHIHWLKNRDVCFVHNNAENSSSLLKYNNIGIERVFMGCDFNFWVPGNSIEFRKKFNIKNETIVFSMASRFNSLKQIDRIIKILVEIDKDKDRDFKLLIAGHGEDKYEEYLKRISSDLMKKNKLYFCGYISGEDLLKFYQASNFFISASTAEGGPVSVVKAFACEIPVICTRVGGVDDIMARYDAGILVDRYHYNQWKEKLIEVLTGKIKVKPMDREKAKAVFHWPNIAGKFISIYRKLSDL